MVRKVPRSLPRRKGRKPETMGETVQLSIPEKFGGHSPPILGWKRMSRDLQSPYHLLKRTQENQGEKDDQNMSLPQKNLLMSDVVWEEETPHENPEGNRLENASCEHEEMPQNPLKQGDVAGRQPGDVLTLDPAIRQSGDVLTRDSAIRQCRTAHGSDR